MLKELPDETVTYLALETFQRFQERLNDRSLTLLEFQTFRDVILFQSKGLPHQLETLLAVELEALARRLVSADLST